MRICFVFHSAYFFRYFDAVVRQLRARGHDVTLLVGDGVMSKNYTDRSLEACVAETGCARARLETRPGFLARAVARVRDFAGYANYFRPRHPAPGWAAQWRTYLDRRVQRLLNNRLVHHFVVSALGRCVLRRIEAWVPADRKIAACIARLRPDVLVATPMVFPGSRDVEYAKAARALGIPTVFAVGSWDHLGGKALCPVRPDVALVWNEEMVWEAVHLHDIPRECIAVVGAPVFDYWFGARPTLERAAFLQAAGLDEDVQYFVYLCSSNPIAGNTEPALVRAIVGAMACEPALEKVRLLVRPYPAMGHVWTAAETPACAIWPRSGEWPDVPQARQNLFHTLYFSAGAIGLNTTAMLEAAIVGRPCISITSEEYRRSQAERAHFQQMLRGGFLETPHSAGEAVRAMLRIVAGCDERASARASFVQRFFRPLGVNQQVAGLYAQAIERTVESRASSPSYASASPAPTTRSYRATGID